ncbi:MAG: hypothetical protein ABI743_11455, partial [bacterium]
MIRSTLLAIALCLITVPSFAAAGDPEQPPIGAINPKTATMAECEAWLAETTLDFCVVRVQYPLDNEWYYFTIESHIVFGGEEGATTLQGEDTGGTWKALGQMSDAGIFTTVALTNLDPASVSEVVSHPFAPLFGPKSKLGDKAAYAEQYAGYVFPGWIASTQKPTAKTEMWTVAVLCDGGEKLVQRQYKSATTAEA